MSSIVWLASFPKSGNTWLRALLTNYFRDGDEPADINELGAQRGGHAASRAVFDELGGLQASTLDPSVIARLRPEVYRQLAKESPVDLFIKVHDAWSRTDLDEPMFPPGVTRGVVYIIRNPLDVVVSWAHHLGYPLEEAVRRMCDGFGPQPQPQPLSDQLPQSVGTWSQHVRSWLDLSGLPCHIVRFEDLQADPERAFADVVCFCGLPEDRALVRKAVGFSSFAELRRQELERGFGERPLAADGEFFRLGEVGGWQSELPVELALRVVEANHELMSRFEYLDEAIMGEVGRGAGLADRA